MTPKTSPDAAIAAAQELHDRFDDSDTPGDLRELTNTVAEFLHQQAQDVRQVSRYPTQPFPGILQESANHMDAIAAKLRGQPFEDSG